MRVFILHTCISVLFPTQGKPLAQGVLKNAQDPPSMNTSLGKITHHIILRTDKIHTYTHTCVPTYVRAYACE